MKRNTVISALLCTAVLFGGSAVFVWPVGAAGTETAPSFQSLPQLQEFISDSADSVISEEESEEAEVTAPVILPPFNHIYEEEELSEVFKELPQYLGKYSFYLNNHYQLPDILYTEEGPVIFAGDSFYQMRPSWETLQEELAFRISQYSGDWSIYLKDLSTGRTMEINEHNMESASLIKLFIAGATLEMIESGEMEEDDTVREALNQMIIVSDNESSNVLVRRMCDESGDFSTGLAKVNDFIERCGFTNTQQVNGIADPSLWVSDGRVNETSTADCGRLLEMIYNHELVSHFASFRFETLLNKQEVNYKIPAALPEGTHISHKTGEVDDTENDAAIIYTPYGDYIFCIMSTNLTDTGTAVDHIHEITKLIHAWFMHPTQKIDLGEDGEILYKISASGEAYEIEEYNE